MKPALFSEDEPEEVGPWFVAYYTEDGSLPVARGKPTPHGCYLEGGSVAAEPWQAKKVEVFARESDADGLLRACREAYPRLVFKVERYDAVR